MGVRFEFSILQNVNEAGFTVDAGDRDIFQHPAIGEIDPLIVQIEGHHGLSVAGERCDHERKQSKVPVARSRVTAFS